MYSSESCYPWDQYCCRKRISRDQEANIISQEVSVGILARQRRAECWYQDIIALPLQVLAVSAPGTCWHLGDVRYGKVFCQDRLFYYTVKESSFPLHDELGEQGLTPASSQVTYLLLLTSFLLASLSYHYAEYKNDYPFHSITFFTPWRLRLCVGYVISWEGVGQQ